MGYAPDTQKGGHGVVKGWKKRILSLINGKKFFANFINILIHIVLLQCNNCAQLVVHPEQRFNFFSDYSQMVSCPHCGSQEAHFAKTLAVYIRADEAQAARQTSMVNTKFYLGDIMTSHKTS